ncbi:MAG TPA: rod shape-determining protein MreD [Syntrophorhabdaceae bacterium]|nr:rod shape-determining protein MreD [Syntrophorhabdaceae bacterium]
MKVSTYILFGIIFSVIESSLLSFIPLEFLKPDVTIPFIVYITFFLKPQAGLITSVIMGIIQEILSTSPNGSMIFSKVLIFLLALFFKNKLYIDSKYSFSYICAGAVVCESLIYILLSWLAKGESKYMENVLFFIFPNAVFTGFVSIFIFSFVKFLNMKFFDKN